MVSLIKNIFEERMTALWNMGAVESSKRNLREVQNGEI